MGGSYRDLGGKACSGSGQSPVSVRRRSTMCSARGPVPARVTGTPSLASISSTKSLALVDSLSHSVTPRS